MSGTHPWLTSIYGTYASDDFEKVAQTQLLAKLAEDNKIDLNQFSPEELQMLLQEVISEQEQAPQQDPQNGMGQPQQAPGYGVNPNPVQPGMGQPNPLSGIRPPMGQPSAFAPAANQQQAPNGGMQGYQMASQQGSADMGALQKEAAAKFEEADLLGRVMAHSYTDELEKIAAERQKTAGRFEGAKSALKGAAGKARDAAAHAHGSAKGYGSRAAEHVKSHKGAYAAGAGAAGAGFAAGRMSKKASAFEKLAEMQAAEILGAAGFDPSTGQDMSQVDQTAQQQYPQQNNQQQQYPVAGQQEQIQGADPGAQFAEALDSRALEMLSSAGYDTNEILARLQFAQQNNQGQA